MGQGVGADLAGYDSTGAFDGGVWWRDYDEFDTEMDCHINKDGNQVVRQPWLRINRDGNRVPYIGTSARVYPYVNDASPSSEGLCETAAIEMSQPGGKTYCIFDSKYEQLMLDNYFGQVICRKGKILADDDPFYDRVPGVPARLAHWVQRHVEAGVIRKCDTSRSWRRRSACARAFSWTTWRNGTLPARRARTTLPPTNIRRSGCLL